MKFLGFEIKRAEPQAVTALPDFEYTPDAPQPEARSGYFGSWYSNFNGEKTPGELGPIIDYTIDHTALTVRSWQLFLESEVCMTVLQRFTRWVIGDGLDMQALPQFDVLRAERIIVPAKDTEKPFRYEIETRFALYSDSHMADHADMQTLHEIAGSAFHNAITGGDVLVILRVKKGELTTQLVDGQHLLNPSGASITGTDYVGANGNRIRNGIEIDATGRHIAYHVRTGPDQLETSRIEARNRDGMTVAFMVYGLRYRLDDLRGLPLIAAVMEKAKKLDRYTEAMIGSAEERAKIAYTIEHDATSLGASPLAGLRQRNGFGAEAAGPDHNILAANIHATSGKQTYNMPNGATMKQLSSDNELNFEGFHGPMVDILCATVGIPPNVAMSKYDDSFSAARAALKDWEHTLLVERKKFANAFYQPIYDLWLYVQALSGKLNVPGYLQAVQTGNRMAMKAYQSAQFSGTNVPHIDPLKEAKAEREKLGTAGAHLPLTTLERATRALNGGVADTNIAQFGDELADAAASGILPASSGGGAELQEIEQEG